MIYKAKMPEAWARMQWCKQHLGPSIKGGNWWRHRGHLYFRNEADYLMFMLRWA